SQRTLYPPGHRAAFDNPAIEAQMRQQDQEMREQWAAAIGYRVAVGVEWPGPQIGEGANADVTVYPIQSVDAGGSPTMARNAEAGKPRARYAWLEACRWARRGNWTRRRSGTWYFERTEEIPLRFVRHWNEAGAARPALPLEELLDAARALTDRQLDGFLVVSH